MSPGIWYAVGVAEAVYRQHGFGLVVTSLIDGVHPDRRNIHGTGLAADLRTRDIPQSTLAAIVRDIAAILDPQGYDVVVESNHLHVEFDPKGAEHWIDIVD